METDDDWIRERSGIEKRYFVEPGTGSSDLEAEADSIDYIVCSCMTPDHYFPGCCTLVQQKIGAGTVPALDIRQQCAGFAYGL